MTISIGRRFLAAAIWLALVLISMEWFGVYRWGRIVTYPAMFASLVGILYLFEHIVILDRRAFTCKTCGYDLQGLPEPRCPECGSDFDPSERQRILDRINAPPPGPKYGFLLLVIVLLSISVICGLIAWKRSTTTIIGVTTTTSTPTTQPISDE